MAARKKKVAEPRVVARSWTELREQWQACTRCDLHTTRRLVVLGAGAVADFMIIGQAPGKDEDVCGVPFQGVGGIYTQAALDIAGIPWARCFFDNCLACKCVKPLKAHLDPCRPRLENTIALVQPKLIISMGAVAAKWLSSTRKNLDSLACTTSLHGDIPVFYCTHPLEPGRLADKPDAYDKSVAKINSEYQSLGSFAREIGLLSEAEE